MRWGDWSVLLVSLLLVVSAYPLLWQGGRADLAVIRSGGKIIAEFPLNTSKTFSVQGALGTTIIEIQAGRARVQADPSPRQYCVKQGWLTRPGALALCAPNQVSLSLRGDSGYDSLSY